MLGTDRLVEGKKRGGGGVREDRFRGEGEG